ncbi:unnamed protein product, partial [Trichogramma brassicae]
MESKLRISRKNCTERTKKMSNCNGEYHQDEIDPEVEINDVKKASIMIDQKTVRFIIIVAVYFVITGEYAGLTSLWDKKDDSNNRDYFSTDSYEDTGEQSNSDSSLEKIMLNQASKEEDEAEKDEKNSKREKLFAIMKAICLPKLVCELSRAAHEDHLSVVERSLLDVISDTSLHYGVTNDLSSFENSKLHIVFLGNRTTHCLFLQQVVSSFCVVYSRSKKPEIKERQFRTTLITQSSVHNYIVGSFRSGRASTASKEYRIFFILVRGPIKLRIDISAVVNVHTCRTPRPVIASQESIEYIQNSPILDQVPICTTPAKIVLAIEFPFKLLSKSYVGGRRIAGYNNKDNIKLTINKLTVHNALSSKDTLQLSIQIVSRSIEYLFCHRRFARFSQLHARCLIHGQTQPSKFKTQRNTCRCGSAPRGRHSLLQQLMHSLVRIRTKHRAAKAAKRSYTGYRPVRLLLLYHWLLLIASPGYHKYTIYLCRRIRALYIPSAATAAAAYIRVCIYEAEGERRERENRPKVLLAQGNTRAKTNSLDILERATATASFALAASPPGLSPFHA